MFVEENNSVLIEERFIFARIFINTISYIYLDPGSIEDRIDVHYLRKRLYLRGNTDKLFVRAGKEKEKSNNAQLLIAKKKKDETSIIVWKIISCSLIVNPMGIVQNTGRLKESRIINFWKCARCVWKVMNIEKKKIVDIILWKILFIVSFGTILLENCAWKA